MFNILQTKCKILIAYLLSPTFPWHTIRRNMELRSLKQFAFHISCIRKSWDMGASCTQVYKQNLFETQYSTFYVLGIKKYVLNYPALQLPGLLS